MNNEKVMNEWAEFGKKMQIIAILTILTFVIPFVGLIQLIYIFLALGNIKNINYEMPDADLSEFRLKYIMGFLVGLIGGFLIFGAVMTFLVVLFFSGYYAIYGALTALIVLLIIAIIITIISAVLEYQAWSCLEAFFEKNRSNFPAMIAEDTLKGIKNMKTAIILDFTIILSIIGAILRIIAYFRIATLKDISNLYGRPTAPQPVQRPQAPPQPQPATRAPPKTQAAGYCPHCGAKTNTSGDFCSECGASLK